MESRLSLSAYERVKEQTLEEMQKRKAELALIEKDLAEHERLRAEICQEPDESLRSVLLYSLEQSVSTKVSRQETLCHRYDKLSRRLQDLLIEEKKLKEEERIKKEAEEKLRQVQAKRYEIPPAYVVPKKYGSMPFPFTPPPPSAQKLQTPMFQFPSSPPIPPPEEKKYGIVAKEISLLDRKKILKELKQTKHQASSMDWQISQIDEKSKKLELSLSEDMEEESMFETILQLEALYKENYDAKIDKLKLTAMSKIGEMMKHASYLQEIVPIKVGKFRAERQKILDYAKDQGVKTKLLDSKYSTTALVVEGLENDVRSFCNWLEKEKLVEIEEKKGKYTHIFVDNSNIFFGAFSAGDKSKGHVRVKVDVLASLLQNSINPVDTMYVVGSSTSVQKDSVEKKWKEAGFKTKFQIRLQKEQLVDDALIAEMNATLLRNFDQPQHLILGTGDGNANMNHVTFPQALETALKMGWSAEVWSWKNSLNTEYRRLQKQYPHLLKIVELDLFKDSLLFYEKFKI